MSSSKVVVTVDDRATGITLVDWQLHEVASGFGSLEVTLAPGVYCARSRVGAESVQQVFIVEEGQPRTVTLSTVSFASPLPLAHTSTSHEYQQSAVQEVLNGITNLAAGSGAQIAVFVRDPMNQEHLSVSGGPQYQDALRGFTIRSLVDGTVVLDGSRFLMNAGGGWAGVRATVNPGAYVLTSRVGGRERHQAVYAVAGRRTDVFIVFDSVAGSSGEIRPRLDDLSISMPRDSQVFAPQNPVLRQLEVARNAFRRGRRLLPADAIDAFLQNADADLMLTLYAAHLARFDTTHGAPRLQQALETLVKEMQNLPDVQALTWDGKSAPTIEWPPMLWSAWMLAVNGSVEDDPSGAIVPKSFADGVAADAVASGPWLAWDGADWNPGADATHPGIGVRVLSTAARAVRDAADSGFDLAAVGDTLDSVAPSVRAVSRGIARRFEPALLNRKLHLQKVPAIKHFDLDSLAGALASVPWDSVIEHLSMTDLSAVQRSLLPTLLLVQSSKREHLPQMDPVAVIADVLKAVETTRSVLVSAAVGLVMTAARLTSAKVTSEASRFT